MSSEDGAQPFSTCRWCGGDLVPRVTRTPGAEVFDSRCARCGRPPTLVDGPHQFSPAEVDPSRCGGCGEGPDGRWHLDGGPTADEWLAAIDSSGP